ncbi:MAG: aromatic-ring-hydroxylating dioxygenase subunit beta [Lautropia sp.]
MQRSALTESVREFIESELWLLDNGQLSEWLDLFDPQGIYWLPVNPSETTPDRAPSLVYESRLALEARIRRLEDSRIVPQLPASRTCRFLSGLVCRALEDSLIEARAKCLTVEARPLHDPADPQRIFAGVSTYRLVRVGESFKIRQKRVDLVNSEAGLHGVSILL